MADINLNSTLSPYTPRWMFDFESSYQPEDGIRWLRDNNHLSVVASVMYVVCVFAGRALMTSRKPFNLRLALAVWSGSLAAFSVVGTVRSVGAYVDIVGRHGWHASVCDPVAYRGTAGFWLFLFALSKLPELGDTVFIVLRKQRLIFLHWYHHITVLLYSWHSFPQVVSLAQPFAVMNYTVHSLMYSYYSAKASRLVRLPNWIGMVITTLQIAQMFVGCGLNGYAYWVRSRGGYCAINDQNLRWAFLMYATYLMLFLRFFYGRYIGNAGVTDLEKKSA